MKTGFKYSLFTFFCLYIAQALPMSFFSTSLQVMMRQTGYSMAAIAMLQIIKLPWVLKFAWSPIVDRNCHSAQSYKKCILISELIYALMIGIVGFLNLSSHFYWILALIVLSLVASATQDIATDALSVRSFSNKNKSMLNSMQSMGSFGGTLLGGGVLLMVMHRFGWHIVMPCLSIFVLIALVPLFTNRSLHFLSSSGRPKARFTDFIWFFTQRGIGKHIGFYVLYYASIISLLSVLRPYLVDLGYSMKDIGLMSGILGTSCAFIASFFGGIIVRRFGLPRARIGFAIMILGAALYFLAQSFCHPSTISLCIGIATLWCSYGLATVVVYTSAMKCVRRGCEGTDFTIQTVITHLSGLLFAILSGMIVDKLGYQSLFVFQTIVAITSLCYILRFFRKRT